MCVCVHANSNYCYTLLGQNGRKRDDIRRIFTRRGDENKSRPSFFFFRSNILWFPSVDSSCAVQQYIKMKPTERTSSVTALYTTQRKHNNNKKSSVYLR